MERTYSNQKIDELIKTIEDSMSAIIRDYGHQDQGYCLACDDEPFDALDEIKRRFQQRPEWPKELHEQYLKVLDERDILQGQIDYIKELLSDA